MWGFLAFLIGVLLLLIATEDVDSWTIKLLLGIVALIFFAMSRKAKDEKRRRKQPELDATAQEILDKVKSAQKVKDGDGR